LKPPGEGWGWGVWLRSPLPRLPPSPNLPLAVEDC